MTYDVLRESILSGELGRGRTYNEIALAKQWITISSKASRPLCCSKIKLGNCFSAPFDLCLTHKSDM
jgi:hypothetical protein